MNELGEANDPLRRLMWSVQALAATPDVQRGLFPGFVCVADELALDFEEGMIEAKSHSSTFSQAEQQALLALDKQLERMSGEDNLQLWTDEALANSAEWGLVRQLAQAVLAAMGWPEEIPPSERAVYIGRPPD